MTQQDSSEVTATEVKNESVRKTLDVPLPNKHLFVDQKAVKDWIDQEPDESFKRIKRKLVDNLQCVPQEAFGNALNRSVDQLNKVLGDQDYVVLWDYKPHSSKRWVYELAKDWLKKP